jgi:cobalamin biosynthesis protein CobD/CbiB
MSVAMLCNAFLMRPEAFTKPVADVVRKFLTEIVKEPFNAVMNPQSWGGAILTFALLVTFSAMGMWFIAKGLQRRRKPLLWGNATEKRYRKIQSFLGFIA